MSTNIDLIVEDKMMGAIEQLSGLLGGVVTQQPQRPISTTGGSCENAGVTVHCLRSVAQRSLSTPTTFLSQNVIVAAGADIFEPLVHGITGCIAGAGPAGTPIDFNDANIQPERARIDNLVLIGMRAKVAVFCITNDPASAFDVGLFTSSISDFIKQYVAIKVFNLSDNSDPWIDTTDLAYFARPSGMFVAVPPLLFKDRDPKMTISTRNADKGFSAGALPIITTLAAGVSVQASILIESLFVPSPSACGDAWPGSLCPPSAVKNSDCYRGR